MPKLIPLNLKQKLIDFLKTVFPETKLELFLFLVFLTAYGVLGTCIALNYRIVFDNRIPWDAYFSFDNRAIVMTGGGFERHPLANYFFDILRNIAFYFSSGKVDFTFRMMLATCSNIAISLSLVQIFIYLKTVIQLPTWISLILILFFSLCFLNICFRIVSSSSYSVCKFLTKSE